MATVMDDAFPEVPGYRFEAKMAEGGMGVVYRAVDDTLGRTVAIKMIRGALLGKGDEEEETVARFLREARAAAQIRSNHVAHVLQFGRTTNGDLFLVLEYLDGVTLADLLRRDKRLSVERAVRITRQICRGMEAAHHLGIVHRDLKPSNVMLVDQDGDPEFVKILDFGVAKVVGERESGVTRAGMLVGTYTCMAPEQVVNETIDARTDVYALAVMLFRLLTGKPLFEGNDVTAVLYHHVHTPAPAPSRVAPDAGIPAALDAIVLRCLEKQPHRRVRSMADLDRALGLSLDLGASPEQILEQAPTAISGVSANDETRTSYASREPTAEAEDGEVFAESGPIRSMVDPGGPTQITESGALPAPTVDPPTPNTSTGSREPASLRARTGDPLLSSAPEAPLAPARRRPLAALVAAAVVVAVVLVAGMLLARGGGEEDVVVVVKPADATPPSPPPAPAPAPVVEEPAAPASDVSDGGALPDEAAAANDAPPRDPTGEAAAPSLPPKTTTASDTGNADAKAEARKRTAASAKARAARTQRARKAARKKDVDDDGRAQKPAAGSDDKKPRPRFIRVRTGDQDG